MSDYDPFQGKKTLIEERTALDMAKDKKSAEQWLVDFLKERKNNIFESFGLTRVKYHTMNNKGPLIRWICHKCKNDGFQRNMLEDFPMS
jgi:hypothetical protein